MPNACKREHQKKNWNQSKREKPFGSFIALVEKQIPIEYQMEGTTWKWKTVSQILNKFKESTSTKTFVDVAGRCYSGVHSISIEYDLILRK